MRTFRSVEEHINKRPASYRCTGQRETLAIKGEKEAFRLHSFYQVRVELKWRTWTRAKLALASKLVDTEADFAYLIIQNKVYLIIS